MNFKIQQHRLTALSARFNLMVAIVCLLLISNVLMASLVGYMVFHQRIEITPFFAHPHYEKSDAVVDTQYLALMSENFLYSRLNVTPETVRMNHKRLLSFVDSSHYAVFEAQLAKEAKVIIGKKISSHFEISELKIDSDKLTCYVKGTLKRAVGARDLTDAHLKYFIQYRYHFGKLTVMQFTQEVIHETH